MFRWDWKVAGITPLTEEADDEVKRLKAEKAKQKKKEAAKRAKERKQAEKQQEAEKKVIEDAAREKADQERLFQQASVDARKSASDRNKTINAMSDREKRAAAAERRSTKKTTRTSIMRKRKQKSPYSLLRPFSFSFSLLFGPFLPLVYQRFHDSTVH